MSQPIFTKFPKKEDGLKILYEVGGIQYKLHCEPTGTEFNGVPSLAWYHENNEQANRSINGKITFIIPTDDVNISNKDPIDVMVDLPELDNQNDKIKIDKVVQLENYLNCYAYNIAATRYPKLVGKDMFGQIQNAIKNSMIELYKGL